MTDARSRSDLVSTLVIAGFGVFTLVLGFWALIDTSSFFDNIGHFPPYNRHFLHDVGAFQIGIGGALLFALAWRDDAILAVLGGAAAGATAHEIAHIADSDLGGRDSDPFTLGIIAAILLAAFAWRLRLRYRATVTA
ncbi:MAG TPA: hypothetical protein VMT90_10250 [Dehalococcoidia bacterium]|jgi:hypothetical protein|nr:hypothetical protein [Dehalococcoidia bacterium]